MNYSIGVDVGGTTIKIGKFINDHLDQKVEIPTRLDHNGELILQDIKKAIESISDLTNIEAIGFGLPGPVVNGWIIEAKNLGWPRFDFINTVKKQYPNIKIYAQNDANCATIGEQIFGGGKQFQNFVFVTLGTGVGGGIVLNGELVVGKNGAAGEIGHLKVHHENTRKCTCGLYDCLEQYASATGIVRTAKNHIENVQTMLQHSVLTSEAIFNAAKLEDPFAISIVDLMIDKLAIGLSMVADVVNPEAFVIGGGVSKAGSYLLSKLKTAFHQYAFHAIDSTEFVLAELGNDAGMYGASVAARRKGI